MRDKNIELQKIQKEQKIDEKLFILSIQDELKTKVKDYARKNEKQQLLENLERCFLDTIQETHSIEIDRIDSNRFIASLIIKIKEKSALYKVLQTSIEVMENHFDRIKKEREYIEVIEQYSIIPFQDKVKIEEQFRQMNQKINTYYNEEKEKELKSEFTNYLNLLLEKQTNNWTRNSINTFYDSFEKITKEDLLNKVKRKELTINDLNDQYQWFFQKFSNNEQQLLLMISCYEISEGKAFISFIELWRYFNINPIEYVGMMSKLFYSYYLKYKEIDNMQYEELEKIIKKRR